MATTAQIAANRRNAAKSTGPKSDQGKARARLNALRHGANARIAIPVLPQEDPKELAERILQWTFELVPRNDVERTLVGHAVRIDWQIDRAERAETAYLAARVHRQRDRDEATRLKQAHILGRKLLDTLDPRERFGKAEYYDDMPAVFLARLEQIPEGCRWLLARWSEFRNLIDVRAAWSETDHYRFLRLMGKSFLEGMIDPAANRVFQAVDAIEPGQGRELWELFRNMKASSGPYFSGAMPWRRLSRPPASPKEGWEVLSSIVDEAIHRLEARLGEHEDLEQMEADAEPDRAVFAASKALAVLRRHQGALTRELLRTLTTLSKLQKAELGADNNNEADRLPMPVVHEPQVGPAPEPDARQPHDESRNGRNEGDGPGMASSGGISPHAKVCKTVGCAALTHPTGGSPRVSRSVLNEANVLAMQVESGKEDTAVAERDRRPEGSQSGTRLGQDANGGEQPGMATDRPGMGSKETMTSMKRGISPHAKVCKTVGCAALTHPTSGAPRVSQSILNEANDLAMQVESGKEDTAVAERDRRPERSQIRERRRKSRIGPSRGAGSVCGQPREEGAGWRGSRRRGPERETSGSGPAAVRESDRGAAVHQPSPSPAS